MNSWVVLNNWERQTDSRGTFSWPPSFSVATLEAFYLTCISCCRPVFALLCLSLPKLSDRGLQLAFQSTCRKKRASQCQPHHKTMSDHPRLHMIPTALLVQKTLSSVVSLWKTVHRTDRPTFKACHKLLWTWKLQSGWWRCQSSGFWCPWCLHLVGFILFSFHLDHLNGRFFFCMFETERSCSCSRLETPS